MKEIPMLFSTEMVKAILEGRKTQTRRLKFRGEVGDRIWVRETWQETTWMHPSDENYGYIYKASENGEDWESNSEDFTWRPSIFMPRAASRITLEVVAVREGGLLEINFDDVRAEGFTDTASFMAKWDKLNGKKAPFDSNPTVKVVTFKVL